MDPLSHSTACTSHHYGPDPWLLGSACIQALADAGAAQDDKGAAATLPGAEGAAGEEQQQQRELARRLRNVQQEVLAVQGALTGVQQGLGPMAGAGPDAPASAAAAGAEPGGAGKGKRRAFGTGISRGKAARTAVAADAATSSLAATPLSAGQAAALPVQGVLAGGGGSHVDDDDAGTAAEGHATGVQLQQAVLQSRLQALQDERSRLQVRHRLRGSVGFSFSLAVTFTALSPVKVVCEVG